MTVEKTPPVQRMLDDGLPRPDVHGLGGAPDNALSTASVSPAQTDKLSRLADHQRRGRHGRRMAAALAVDTKTSARMLQFTDRAVGF